jgi:hypothetical protein
LDADCKVKVQQGIIALAPKINISGPTRNTNTADNLSDNTYMDLLKKRHVTKKNLYYIPKINTMLH